MAQKTYSCIEMALKGEAIGVVAKQSQTIKFIQYADVPNHPLIDRLRGDCEEAQASKTVKDYWRRFFSGSHMAGVLLECTNSFGDVKSEPGDLEKTLSETLLFDLLPKPDPIEVVEKVFAPTREELMAAADAEALKHEE
mgnify:CR=1 FL=1